MLLIPESDGFFVTETGRIYDKDGKERNYYTNGDGYITASISIGGKWQTFGVQRLVMLTYEPIDNPDDYTVNHIDLDKTNNNKPNLEWLTTKWNNIHSAIFNSKGKRPVVRCLNGDEEMFIKDMMTLPTILGVDIQQIWFAIKNSTQINGWSISPIPYDDKEIIRLLNSSIGTVDGPVRPVRCLDIETGIWKNYKSMKEMANEFGVGITHIRHRLATFERPRIFLQRYIILDDGVSDEFITPELIAMLKMRGNKPVLAVNIENQETRLFNSASEFIKTIGLSKKAVTTRLASGKITPVDGWVFKYVKDDLDEEKKALVRTL